VKSGKILILILLFTLIAACGGGGGGNGGGGSTTPTLASISVSPLNPSIVKDTSQQFTATGTYTDNTTQDLTTSVTWSSSLTSVATISNTAGSNGKATAVFPGNTTITAMSGAISGSTTLTVISSAGTNNVMTVTVNGSLCSTNSYINKVCVSVIVCTPGTSTCQTINDILLDTGSSGLRIFKQALNVSLQQVMAGSASLAECVQFADGSSEWGPIQTAGVILGNEPAVQVPIQVLDATFGTPPAACQNADLGPANAGFNGLLGVGLFAQDCGSTCVTFSNNGLYYACNGTSCTGTVVALTMQVQNPVSLLPQDNNGVILQLPGVDSGGALSVNGNLILGIGTQSNNAPTAVTAYSTNQFGEFTTNFNGSSLSSFIDSGSNGLFFPSPSPSELPNCPSPNSAWFCPSTTTSFSATNTAASGSPSGMVTFQIGNFNSLMASPNYVFSDIGGSFTGYFDWGVPFILGRSIYIGIEGKSSSLGSGPYWAY
jgi:hypothetical protein